MANCKYSHKEVIDITGVLDVNENGERVINIELKEESICILLDELIDKSMGHMISFKRENEIEVNDE